MCYEVPCSTCGKTTWAGCGKHVPGVYKRIKDSHHCLCRDWPGVNPTAVTSVAEDSPSTCTIL